MAVRLSVNINKIALLRNARGGNLPDVISFAKDCESYGAQGITVHPRPDERHIKYKDVFELAPVLKTEFNIEGNPVDKFMDLVLSVLPHQVTLVPDEADAITSDSGWNTVKHQDFLKDVVKTLKNKGIRTSLFIDPVPEMIVAASNTGIDRIELYTGPYAHLFPVNKKKAIKPYIEAAKAASDHGLGINAGHDLNLQNLKYFSENISALLEVSIGHALNCDALYYGIENTIPLYLRELNGVLAT